MARRRNRLPWYPWRPAVGELMAWAKQTGRGQELADALEEIGLAPGLGHAVDGGPARCYDCTILSVAIAYVPVAGGRLMPLAASPSVADAEAGARHRLPGVPRGRDELLRPPDDSYIWTPAQHTGDVLHRLAAVLGATR